MTEKAWVWESRSTLLLSSRVALGMPLSSSEPQLLIFKGAVQIAFFFSKKRKVKAKKEGRKEEKMEKKEGRRKETCFLHRVILRFKMERCI